MWPRPPHVSSDACASSRTRLGTACPRPHCGREPLWTLPPGWLQPAVLCPSPRCALLDMAPPALPNAPLLSLQSIIPLMKFLESELQYLNEHLVQENFKR